MKKLITLLLVSLSILSCSPAEDDRPIPVSTYQGIALLGYAIEFVYENDSKNYTIRLDWATNKIYHSVEPDGVNEELNITKTIIYRNYQDSAYDYAVYYTDVVKDAIEDSPVMTVVIAYDNKTHAYYSTMLYSDEKFDYNPNTYIEVTRTK